MKIESMSKEELLKERNTLMESMRQQKPMSLTLNHEKRRKVMEKISNINDRLFEKR